MAKMQYISDDKESFHVNLARLKKGGDNFEVPVNVNEAIRFKEGRDIDVKDVVNAPHIFFDAHKGELASETHMKSIFGTSDPFAVAKVILTDGELQLTEEIRDKERERKKNEIITRIARDAIDPKTKLPHPPARIKLALEEARVRIDEFRTVDHQIEKIIDKLRVVLPISFEKKVISITVPGEYAGKCQSPVRNKGGIKEEDWGDNGQWTVVVELHGGAAMELITELKSITHGRVEIKDL